LPAVTWARLVVSCSRCGRTCLAGRMAVDIPCHDLVAIYHGSLKVFYTSTSHYKSTWLYILNHF
jgi:hypothetical protein